MAVKQLRVARVICAFGAAIMATAAYGVEITIVNTQGLAFGSFAAGSGGTVMVSPAGTCTAGGDVVLLSLEACTTAEFTVSGDPNATYTIDLPADGTSSLSGPGTDMAVTLFTSNPATIGMIGAGGTQVLSVGATLNVNSNQPAGAYSGSFSVIVNYN